MSITRFFDKQTIGKGGGTQTKFNASPFIGAPMGTIPKDPGDPSSIAHGKSAEVNIKLAGQRVLDVLTFATTRSFLLDGEHKPWKSPPIPLPSRVLIAPFMAAAELLVGGTLRLLFASKDAVDAAAHGVAHLFETKSNADNT